MKWSIRIILISVTLVLLTVNGFLLVSHTDFQLLNSELFTLDMYYSFLGGLYKYMLNFNLSIILIEVMLALSYIQSNK